MEACARDGLWSIRRRNVSTRSRFPPFLHRFPQGVFFLFLFGWFSYFNSRYRQLSRRRDLGRDGRDQDGDAYIRKDDARETRVARDYAPSTFQQPREHHRAH